ncbi:hypothetical protein FACS1894200_04530 [Spirochaetia bacterium]|nr:hypothetical protein FACS1894200_04530 [Spirochaetia bacterium]
MKKLLFLLLVLGYSTGIYAQVTINGGFALSMVSPSVSGASIDSGTGIGGNISFDYRLPSSPSLSLGGEIGIHDSPLFSATVNGNRSSDVSVLAIPMLFRAAYHFDLPIPQLDFYLVGKIGWAFGFVSYTSYTSSDISIDDPDGFAFGIDVGAAYYFTPSLGVFGELGFDDYMLSADVGDAPFYHFLTLGLSLKI